MTLKELKNRLVSNVSAGYGHRTITFLKNGKNCSITTNNMVLTDALDGESNHYTEKQAYQTLWDMCKR